MLAYLGIPPVFAFLQNFGPMEMAILLGVGILLFGKRLPEVGRSLGKGIVEFKKGLKGIEDEIDESSSRPANPRPDDRVQAEAPKFEIPPSPPKSDRA
ncbi:MAG: twin-arginine translocase TatA/TatE family subunit [Planctomycetota bacterium]